MTERERRELFDTWAGTYDPTSEPGNFPFAAYDEILDGIVRLSGVRADATVLDLGVGTGNLAGRFAAQGCRVWGVDFSREMLAQARERLPHVQLVQADLLADWPDELPGTLDCIASAYVLHEFPLSQKLAIVQRAAERLAGAGRIVIGDIAFGTEEALEQARRYWQDVWDDEEHYWVADSAVAAHERQGLAASYLQVSACGGIFVTAPGGPLPQQEEG